MIQLNPIVSRAKKQVVETQKSKKNGIKCTITDSGTNFDKRCSGKVNSVQEACTKYFAVHTRPSSHLLKFEILPIT